MKTWLIAFSTCSASVLGCWLPAFCAASDYVGKIGDQSAGMTIYTNDPSNLLKRGNVTGSYFYDRIMKDLKIDGSTDGQRGIKLYEYDPSGKKTAVFTGTLAEHDPSGQYGQSKLSGDVIVGTWSRLDGTAKVPFYFHVTASDLPFVAGENRYEIAGVRNAAALELKARRFREAVIAGNRKSVASMISYPIDAYVNGKPKELRNSAELLRNYDSIFKKPYVEAIRAAVPHNMFAKDTGVMLGDTGEVWFDANGKVEGLNDP